MTDILSTQDRAVAWRAVFHKLIDALDLEALKLIYEEVINGDPIATLVLINNEFYDDVPEDVRAFYQTALNNNKPSDEDEVDTDVLYREDLEQAFSDFPGVNVEEKVSSLMEITDSFEALWQVEEHINKEERKQERLANKEQILGEITDTLAEFFEAYGVDEFEVSDEIEELLEDEDADFFEDVADTFGISLDFLKENREKLITGNDLANFLFDNDC